MAERVQGTRVQDKQEPSLRLYVEPANNMAQSQLADIIARARAGNSQAWGELYRLYAPAIFRFCRRALPAREDAEDATMEIFIKLREKLDQYDPARPFKTWLYKVAANHCWDILRRRSSRQSMEIADVNDLPLESADPDQLAQLIEAQTSSQVRAALAKLPARAQMALVLRYFAEMSYDEIGDSLGLSRATVGVVILRARHQLRDALTGMAPRTSGETS
jgi:RNA polymerase sigma factor (sigma-70 family)